MDLGILVRALLQSFINTSCYAISCYQSKSTLPSSDTTHTSCSLRTRSFRPCSWTSARKRQRSLQPSKSLNDFLRARQNALAEQLARARGEIP